MRVGVNWTYPQTFSIIKNLYADGLIDFCELSLDNFIHLPPDSVLEILEGMPVSFHILSSRFLEKSETDLCKLSKHIKYWIKTLKPMYVSDHLAQFSYEGRLLPLFIEIDYKHDTFIKHRVQQWQDMLKSKIYFENYPSLPLSLPNQQVKFFEELMQETQAGLLFDFSNAYIAEINGVEDFNSWLPLAKETHHYHVGGFRMIGDPAIAVDTHDEAVSEEVFQRMSMFYIPHSNSSIVIEFDKNINFISWKDNIERLRKCWITSD